MAEKQYASYASMPETRLGVMSNELWQRDPKMVGIHLARYKFVAKMLSGKKRVAEIGCGDAWYSEIVKREVGELILYDFDVSFINDIVRRGGIAYYHDILESHIKGDKFDAIYSLDVFEHIADSDKYLSNIVASLSENGVFIVGIPSKESQKYASKASKEGHVNCVSGSNFKDLLSMYFSNVFIFGMNDETLHTGFYPMCHYLIAICTK